MPLLGDTHGRRVLVVDDDPFLQELVMTRLVIAGYAVQSARDGLEAVARLGDFRPHAMVLDLNMPVMDGFAVLEHMRMHKITSTLTLVLTARNAAEDVSRAIRLGARDYLAKPFRDEALTQRVGRLFARASRPS